VYGFLYVEDYQLRLELLVPLATLETLVEIPRENPEVLTVAEQLAARDRVAALFEDRIGAELDGVDAPAALNRLDVYGVDFRDFAMRPERRDVGTARARVGAILTWNARAPLQRARVTFDIFNPYIPVLRCNVFTRDGVEQKTLMPQRPYIAWEREGEAVAPDIRLAPVEDRKPDDRKVAAIFGALLRNIYRAFDFRIEEEVYDALAGSVGGELLSTLYLEIRRGLVVAEQGGALSRVRQVDIVDAERAAPVASGSGRTPGFGVRATWRVAGTVEHWGHVHERVNQYEALFTIRALDGAWKITGLEMLDQERVSDGTSLRTF
jgi:hypothetical protein